MNPYLLHGEELKKTEEAAKRGGGPYYDPQTMEDTARQAQHVKKAVEAMAHIQNGLENCYNDTRVAIDLERRGLSIYNVLSRIEHTLADVLTILNNYSSK